MKEHERAQESESAVRHRPGRKPAPEAAPSVAPGKPEVAEWLNRLLADEFILYTKTLNDHWNVRGMQFSSLHEFFEVLYHKSLELSDDVAERVRTVGGTALGTMEDFLKNARLQEQKGFPPDPRGMISNLMADHESIIATLREGIDAMEERFDDPGTCNFLTDLLEKHEKLAWMLRTHLDKDLG
jgi:starvation-inducible DNA-binding protein